MINRKRASQYTEGMEITRLEIGTKKSDGKVLSSESLIKGKKKMLDRQIGEKYPKISNTI